MRGYIDLKNRMVENIRVVNINIINDVNLHCKAYKGIV